MPLLASGSIASAQVVRPTTPQSLAQGSTPSSNPGQPQTIPRIRRSASMNSPHKHQLNNFADPAVGGIPHLPGANPRQGSTIGEFSRTRQRNRLFRNGGIKLATTTVFCAMVATVLGAYSRPYKQVLTNREQQTFDAFITALQIGIGLNVTSSLRSYAKMLRWRILAVKHRPLREVDLILDCHEQTKVLKLLWLSRRSFIPTTTQLVCFLWLFINFAGPLIIALLGLTYSLTQDFTVVSSRPGKVKVLDMSNLDAPSIASDYRGLTDCSTPTDLLGTGTNQEYKCTWGGQFDCPLWTYTFQDSNPNSTIYGASERSVNATASCTSHEILRGPSANETKITYLYQDGNRTQELYEYSPEAAIYIYDSSPTAFCGPRCAMINAYIWAGSPLEAPSPKTRFYTCTNTISPVSGSLNNNDLIALNDSTAQQVAAAIALEIVPNSPQSYAKYLPNLYGSWFIPGTNGISIYTTENAVATQISQYSMSAIAVADQGEAQKNRIRGNHVEATNDLREPYYATYLDVNWEFAAIILAIIPIIQFITLLTVMAFANKAIVKDDSYLSIAKSLISAISKLGDNECILSGEEMVNVLRGKGTGSGV